jgi:hypothetical protein
MAIISCSKCGRQVSDKALKCPQCAHPIANTNFQRESSLDHLQLLQEKIQEKLKDLCITVKIISVGNSLNIKLTRPAWLRINKSPTLSQVWIQIKPELTQDVLRGFNNLLITSTFEGDITSEWERQSDIDSTGKILPNKEQKTALQRWLKLLGISVAGAIAFLTTLVILAKWIEASREQQSKETVNNPPRTVKTTSSPSTSSPSTSSPENLPPHTVASRVSLGSNRERIQVNSLNPQLSKGDCEKLADNYKPQGGQVSVHKPSLKFKKLFPQATEQEIMKPFCVNNLDGTGIFFNDYFFEGK